MAKKGTTDPGSGLVLAVHKHRIYDAIMLEGTDREDRSPAG